MSDTPAGRVLIVEDEPKLAALLGEYLRAADFETDWVADGREVIDRVTESPPRSDPARSDAARPRRSRHLP